MIHYSDIDISILTIITYFSLMICAICIRNFFIVKYGNFRIKEYLLYDTDTKYFIIEEIFIIGWKAHMNSEFSIYDNYTESKRFSSYESALNFFSTNNMYKDQKLINY